MSPKTSVAVFIYENATEVAFFQQQGKELAQQADFFVGLTQADLARQFKLLDTSPALWKRRQSSLSDEEKLFCQCKTGEVRWLPTASRPDICARLA